MTILILRSALSPNMLFLKIFQVILKYKITKNNNIQFTL